MTECQGCSKCWPEDLLDELRDPLERVLPGDEMPAGECPDCGAACLLLDAAPTTRLPNRFSHLYAFAFTVVNRSEDGETTTPGELRAALLARLSALDDGDLLEACGLPMDTYEVGP
jgi:hypothetical protein